MFGKAFAATMGVFTALVTIVTLPFIVDEIEKRVVKASGIQPAIDVFNDMMKEAFKP